MGSLHWGLRVIQCEFSSAQNLFPKFAMWRQFANRDGIPRQRRASQSSLGGSEGASSQGQGDSDTGLSAEVANPMRAFARSRGKTHGAAIAAGIARSQVKRAAETVQKFMVSPAQDVARVTFSLFSRGQNSAQTRHVYFD